MDKNLYDLASEDTRLGKKSRNEYAGPCPNPDCSKRTDGFVVRFDKNGGRGGFMCRGCWEPTQPPIRPDRPRWGDFIDYYRHFRGMTFSEAQRAVAEYLSELVEGALTRVETIAERNKKPLENEPPSEQWQTEKQVIVRRAIHRLWNEKTPVLDYLRARGFKDETIKSVSFGAIHSSEVSKLYLARIEDDTWFVVIPWFIDNKLWQVEMRDIRPDATIRYRDWPGSGNGLYLADSLKRKLPTFMVESAFCAAILAQEAGDLRHRINVVATGSTDGAMTSKWAMKLARMPVVFLSQDHDTSGEEVSTGNGYWARVLRARKPIRFRPMRKDINDMLLAGWDIRKWIQIALSILDDNQDQASVTHVTAAVQQVLDLPENCSVCGKSIYEAEDFYYDGDGIPFCNLHYVSDDERRASIARVLDAMFGEVR